MLTDRNTHASYMLRRFLCPYNYEETVAEVVALCRRYRIDEVMWIPTSQVPRLGMEPLEKLRTVLPCLDYARDRLAAIGVKHSVNVFFTLGHGEYGVDTAALLPGVEFMVDYAGARARMTACPLSPAWQDWVRETYAMLAATRPVRLWIDDDFRYCGHHAVEWGCYCPRHLEAFGRIAGACVTREELVQAILRPGSPHPWRTPWLNLLQGTLADVARMLAGAVHEVSPETEIGWMTTNAEMMAIEGRDPRVQIDALVHPENPQPRAAIRITMGGYAEGNLRQFLSQDLALKKVLGCLPAATLRCTEIEGCPNSSYAKSAAWYRAEMAWACVLGAPHQTLNVYDYYGGAMADSPEVGRMLRASRPALDAVAQAAAGAAHRGVRLFHPPHSAREVHTQDGSDMWETKLSATGWANPLRAIGVPVCFEGEQEVAAVTGQVFRCLGREEILALFRRGVLLDLSALRVLQELGLGHLAGATLVEEMEAGTRVYGVEEVTDPEYGGGEHTYLWWNSFSAPTIGRLEPAPTARVISALRGPDPGLELPGMTLFENELGGRVAVTPQDYSGTLRSGPGPSIFYYLPRRKRMMQPLARWLAQDRLPLEVDAPGWVLPHRADRDGRILVGVMNVNLDPWRGIAMSLTAGGPVRSVTKLDKNGTWADVPDGTWDQQGTQVTVRLRARVDPLQVVSLLLRIG